MIKGLTCHLKDHSGYFKKQEDRKLLRYPSRKLTVIWNLIIAVRWIEAGGFRLYFGDSDKGHAGEYGK